MTPRRSLLIGALFFTPLAIGGIVLTLYLLREAVSAEAEGGDYFLLGLVAFFSLLLIFQAMTALLDLRAEPVKTEGIIVHKWSRNDLVLFGESSFLRVLDEETERQGIFKIDKFNWLQLKNGDRVLIEHYPHTQAVESIQKLVADGPG
ncbi:MAG: hypothetical protein WEB00_10415 [Dehalococcoidia bacterium]